MRYDYVVKRYKGRPVLCENDQPRPIVMYSPGDAFGNEAKGDVDRFLSVGWILVLRNRK